VAGSDFTEQKALLSHEKKRWEVQLLTADSVSSQSLERGIRK